MALRLELKRYLESTEEPVEKKIKVADNIYKNNDFPINGREILLIKWLCNNFDEDNLQSWQQLLDWTSSDNFKKLNRNELSFDDFVFINEFIKEKFEKNNNTDISSIISQIVINIIENPVFREFIKFAVGHYCEFISTVIKNTQNVDSIINIVKNESFLHKNFWTCPKSHKYVLEMILPQLIHKINDDCESTKVLFIEVSKILQQNFFIRNGNVFEAYFESFLKEGTSETSLPKLIFKFLKRSYQEDINAQNSYKIIFHAFCSTYNRDFINVFKFFAFSTLQLGFDCTEDLNFVTQFTLIPTEINLNKSLHILLGLLEVLSEICNADMGSVLQKIKFYDFLQYIGSTIIKIKPNPDEICFKIFEQIILIHPLSIEPIIDDIIIYFMLPKHGNEIKNYEQLLNSLMTVFMKLHRVETFLRKLMATLKEAYLGTYKSSNKCYEFCGDLENKKITFEMDINKIFPISFLDCFTKCISSLQTGDVIILYKSLLKELNSALEIEGLENSNKCIYVEVVCVLLSRFLASVRVAEHTVPQVSVNKFLKLMEEQKLCLGKFGNMLLNLEHNNVLMASFLNVSYIWADLYIILIYYSCNKDMLEKKVEIDNNTNITEFHNYLSKEQWCLFSERIKNFGDAECKQIMHNLHIQKFKALTLFQPNLQIDEIKQLLINSVTSTLEDNYTFLLNDKFCENELLEEFEESLLLILCEDIIDKSLESDINSHLRIHNLEENLPLMCSMLKAVMNRIANLVTKKNDQLVSAKIHTLFYDENMDIKMIENIFESASESESKIKFNQKHFSDLLNIVKHLPVIYLPVINQSKLYLFTWGLLVDLKNSKNIEEGLIQNVEDIILGMIQNGANELAKLLKPSISMKLIGYLNGYESFYKKMLPKAIRDENDMKTLKKYSNIVSKDYNEKNLNCAVITLKLTYQFNKKNKKLNKMDLEDFSNIICKNIANYITNDDRACSIEIFGLILNHFLVKGDRDNVNKLRPHLENYITLCEKDENIKNASCLLLFDPLLKYKTDFEDIIGDDFLLKIWKLIKEIDVNKADKDIFSKILGKICYDISQDNYRIICKDLLDNSVFNKEDQFINVLKIWTTFLECDTDLKKNEILIKTLEELLFKLINIDEIDKNSKVTDSICQFHVHLIKKIDKVIPTPEMMDLILMFTSDILRSKEDSIIVLNWSMSIMEALISYRKIFICDLLPPYLQRYRTILEILCKNCDSNEAKDMSTERNQKMIDISYRFLKLTRYLCQLDKNINSVAMYLIPDILKQYEVVTLFPNIKDQLNHCIYEFIAVCDLHSINCLNRILSPASTESFKLLCNAYKKYYSFTGKV